MRAQGIAHTFRLLGDRRRTSKAGVPHDLSEHRRGGGAERRRTLPKYMQFCESFMQEKVKYRFENRVIINEYAG